MNTADRILQIVKEAGVPDRNIRSTLATLCGVSVQAVRDWFEYKTKNISHEYLILIAKEYRVSIDWLLTGKGNRQQKNDDIATQLAAIPDEDMLETSEKIASSLTPAGRRLVLRALLKAEQDALE